jgi:hypothetical protein
MKPQVTVQLTTDATMLEENYHRTPTALGHQQVDLPRAATAPAALAAVAPWWLMATPAAEAAAVGAPHTGLEGEPVAEAIAEAEATQTTTSPGVSRGGYDARRRIEEIRRKKSSMAGENDGFPAFSARLRNLLLSQKFKPLRITKYDAKQDPIQWLRCYALSIENAGGNNVTKCLNFPFCLDQAPLIWLESPKKYSIDKWD